MSNDPFSTFDYLGTCHLGDLVEVTKELQREPRSNRPSMQNVTLGRIVEVFNNSVHVVIDGASREELRYCSHVDDPESAKPGVLEKKFNVHTDERGACETGVFRLSHSTQILRGLPERLTLAQRFSTTLATRLAQLEEAVAALTTQTPKSRKRKSAPGPSNTAHIAGSNNPSLT